jgi:hypothetical protein
MASTKFAPGLTSAGEETPSSIGVDSESFEGGIELVSTFLSDLGVEASNGFADLF